jgi:hypothetical protein
LAIDTRRNKRAALKLMRKLLKKHGFAPDKLGTDDLRPFLGLQPVISGSQNAMNVADGATIEPRIRINRPDDENTRCKVSKAPGQRKISLLPCSCPQHIQRPMPSHLSKNAPSLQGIGAANPA